MAAATVTPNMNDTSTINPRLRKRTKTGCLTCRRRRIKCGEERPTCNNCIKSKRHCEGYNQRVIFKPPIGEGLALHHGGSTLLYHNGLLPGTAPALQRAVPPPINTGHPSAMQPHPTPMYGIPINEHGQAMLLGTPTVVVPQYQAQQQTTPQTTPYYAPQSFATISPPYFEPIFSAQATVQPDGTIGGNGWPQQPLQSPPYTDPAHAAHQPAQYNPNLEFIRREREYIVHEQPPASAGQAPDFKPNYREASIPTPASSATLRSSETLKREDSVHQWIQDHGLNAVPSFQTAHHPVEQEPIHQGDFISQTVGVEPTMVIQEPIPISSNQATFPSAFADVMFSSSPNQILIDAAVEVEDDDYFDVLSEEEMDLDPGQAVVKAYETSRDFSMMLSLHRDSTNELTMRRYDNFLYAGILDFYRVEWAANPLKNPNTARVFMHFITSTGPTLSIFERHPRNTSALFDDFPSATNPQHGLWTYTLPLMALNHQGLLHAMLAISSLHIAKLQGASRTPSTQHYMYSVKRLKRVLSNPKKRLQPTTLAATLLLAFYEVMTAEHLRWCSHLSGARQLITQLDYLSMAQEARRERAQRASQQYYDQNGALTTMYGGEFSGSMEDPQHPIDEHIVSTFFGKKLNYDDYGRIYDDQSNGKRRKTEIPFDMSTFELYQDLFWWYLKQDCFQSIISGNPLLIDYNRFADCPPRAALGRPDALYGTADHLILLLGRIADFSARDRSRKVKVVEANGGQWRPAPGMNLGGPPPGAPSRNGMPNAQQGQNPAAQHMQQPPQQQTPQQTTPPNPPRPMAGPAFYGMAPSGPVFTPAAYKTGSSSPSAPSPQSAKSEIDLVAATESAIEEWQQMRRALDLFAKSLGPAFQPLPSELQQFQPQESSPFGGVLQYRGYDIACLWALYYMCHIILLRAHPHMPPAAMVAAGVAAAQTALYANLIGQIAYGMDPPSKGQALNPSVGACLCEICMPLFFAGVQFRDPAQRTFLVRRVRYTETVTGWASLGMIAHGCETAWVKAWEAGRGPPWTRIPADEGDGTDERITRRGGHFDPTSPPKDESDRRNIHRNLATRVHWAVGLLEEDGDIERDFGGGE